MLRGDVTNTNNTVFGLTQAGFELTKYLTRGEHHENHYTKDAFEIYEKSYIIYITNIWIVKDRLLYTDSACQKGTYKVRNEIETKRNETKRNQRKRKETKRNQRKRNETKRNQRNGNEMKRNRLIWRKWKEKNKRQNEIKK